MHLNSGLKPICKIWTMDDEDIDFFFVCVYFIVIHSPFCDRETRAFSEVIQPCYQHKLDHKNV